MKFEKNITGFTLVELIVSLSILTIITGLFFANYKSANQQAVLNAAADKLAGDLRSAQSYTLGAKKNEKNGNQVPVGGWGIWVRRQQPNNRFYIIFADSGASGVGAVPQEHDTQGDFDYQQIDFPKNSAGEVLVEIDDLAGLPHPNDNSIVFLPPDPVVYYNGAPAANAVGSIRLRDTRTGKTKKILINSFGLIDVE